MVTKELLKNEIDQIDTQHLEALHQMIQSLRPRESTTAVQRQPSPKISGQGKILGDIMTPIVPIEDWNVLG